MPFTRSPVILTQITAEDKLGTFWSIYQLEEMNDFF
jgi:hypothetical protein